MELCNVLLVDDHVVFRDCMKLLLRPCADLRVVGEASGPPDAYQVAISSQADVVLLDLKLREGDGLSVLRELRRRNPACRVLIVTMVDDPARAAEAFEAGALGYVTKDEPFENVAEAIRAVRTGARYLSTRLSSTEVEEWRRRTPRGDPLVVLTMREREIFDLIVQGLTSAQVGVRLFISPRTVETHRARILDKLRARSVIDLVRLAARQSASTQPS